jgi:hypothetical protein
MTESITAPSNRPFKILSLDGGGAKGFYTLGILSELEKNMGKPLNECFDLVYGTSTGAIIATLVARGDRVEDIIKLYKEHVPKILRPDSTGERTAALAKLTKDVFGATQIKDFKTGIGIVATNWKEERPFIFKIFKEQAHSSQGSFVPFFGCTVAQAVQASCSAYPYFETVTLDTSKGRLELGDGGFCANNPTLYALADATKPLKYAPTDIRVVSLGVGAYPPPHIIKKTWRSIGGMSVLWNGLNIALIRHVFSSTFLQKILDTNTGSMDQLRFILFKDVPTLRINKGFPEPEMATDLLEYDLEKLERLVHKGLRSYEENEDGLIKLLTS